MPTQYWKQNRDIFRKRLRKYTSKMPCWQNTSKKYVPGSTKSNLKGKNKVWEMVSKEIGNRNKYWLY